MNSNPERYERGDIAVEWYNAGEGWDGDYNFDDPEDVNLLRFDFYGRKNGVWWTVFDASYCTQVPADTPDDVLANLLEVLMDEGEGAIQVALDNDWVDRDGIAPATRKVFEELSWIHPDWAYQKK
jgi:hypothetical protein